ncbi:MAG: toxin-antitoxin system YwqK family antitoxin, partial [Parachlamydiaceae bacterium]|nr:toxin-antitoxin system YwqK family antitoxin [Parachlamydiaceae bacterium]
YENGSLNQEKNFLKGVEEGTQLSYYPQIDDQKQILSKELHFINGKLDGVQKSYYPSGLTKAVMGYSEGVLNGKKILWDGDGEISEESSFCKGHLEGKYFVRNSSGKETVYHYKNGLLEGLHQIYYPTHQFFGKIKAYEANYSEGKLDGEAVEYNEAGTKIASAFYSKGQKEGITALYSPNGCLHITAEFKNNRQTGPAYEYSRTGKILKEAYFTDDLHNGPEKIYFDNGKLAALNSFKEGKFHGLCQTWNREGILTYEAEFEEGRRHGKCNKFDNFGNPIVLQKYCNDEVVEKQKFYQEEEEKLNNHVPMYTEER